MNRTASVSRPAPRTPRILVGSLAVVVLLITLGVTQQSRWARPDPTDSVTGVLPGGGQDASDGVIGDGATVSVFDDVPAVTGLDPELSAALRRAANDARADGVEFEVNSGWRSPEYQQQLLNDAVAEYGSAEEAAKWVATPEASAHVSGDAVDIGPVDATSWLAQHGAGYGLCQIYGNEPWHLELRPDAVDAGCPLMYANPTEDPRMQP